MPSNEKLPNALIINRIRCILALITCSILSVSIFFAICKVMLSPPNAEITEVGWKAFRMFTILSNLLMMIVTMMGIPYTIDGLRNHSFHLPKWYVYLMYTGATCLAITFLLCLTVFMPAKGFYRVMIFNANYLIHTLCPIASIILFLFITSDHSISFKASFIAIIPVAIYALTYFVMVFVIGPERGGWRDHYQISRITKYVPIPVIILIVCLIAFIIATILRIVHNYIHKQNS